MPLIKSSSKAARAVNVRRLIDEGYPPRQAVAIAYSTQRAAKAKNRAGRDDATAAGLAARARGREGMRARYAKWRSEGWATDPMERPTLIRELEKIAAEGGPASLDRIKRSMGYETAMLRAGQAEEARAILASLGALNMAGGKRRNRAGRRSAADRLFIGVFPGGISYADRGRSEHGDYARVAFLPYDTLELKVSHGADPKLVKLASEHAKTIAAKRGQPFSISTAGQTVMLGSNRAGGKRRGARR